MLFIGGVTVYGIGAVYGAARAFRYHKPGSALAMADDYLPWNIAFVPDPRGNAAVQLSFTKKF